ncbi:MAG: GTP pyrophosphokinase family protein [Bacilli bacterium]|nr:GTP pyrophosphokinase family protein [Bacilli bacterium]
MEKEVIEQEINDIMINYMCALKILETQIEVFNDEFQYKNNHNPIEHIKTRVKSVESIMKKLEKYNLEFSVDNIIEYINDIIGARIVCSFKSDIYKIVEIIKNSSVLEVIKEKDYIKDPKPSGYASYHLIVNVPVNLSTGIVKIKAEIQIRTIAMDFWASLEHKLNYKFSKNIPNDLKMELIDSAKMIGKLDERMDYIQEMVKNY